MISELTKQTTKQELFDYITAFLLNQGQPSLDTINDVCAYRGSEHRMCAVGCIIPDGVYSVAMEGNIADVVIWRGLAGVYGDAYLDYFKALRPHTKLLQRLQEVHDDAQRINTTSSPEDRKKTRNDWVKGFTKIARDHKLQFSTP